ncbi:hypothetical protein SLE2022_204300 [Rubroshorea leprosula]
MDSRKLSALLSSLVSQLLLLLLLFDSNFHDFSSNYNGNLFSIINHLLSSQEIAASLSLVSVSRKRKRTHLAEPASEPVEEESGSGIGPEFALTRSPDSFKNCFKMSSSTFEWLSGLLEPLLDCRDPVGSPLNLSAEIRLGIGLFRLATGSSYPEIAKRFGVSESVTRFCSRQLCRVLCTNFRFWVAFPGSDELKSVSASFEELGGLPNCCGAIDCTRFNIVKESNGCELTQLGKLKEDSIATQIVVDSSSRILSIVAGFRGDKSNSRILKCSTLYKDVEGGMLLNSSLVGVNGVPRGEYLVGDGGYPLLPWLMVPFVDAVPGSNEEKFNRMLGLMHAPVLRTISSLKSWGVLNKPIEEELKTAVAIIGACSILHNVLLMRDDDSALCGGVGEYSVPDNSSKHHRDTSLEEISIQEKAFVIRNALATIVSKTQV